MGEFSVFIVDDDEAVSRALSQSLRAAGYEPKAFSSAEAFIAQHDPLLPGCVLTDLMMAGMSGLQLQQALASFCAPVRPIIFLTGHGTIPASVKAMQAGAVDFLLKPVKRAELLDAIKVAEKQDRLRRQIVAERETARRRLGTLSPRERDVLPLLVRGLINKNIAADLGLKEKTIKVHRARVLKKMGVRGIAQLVHLAGKLPL